MLTKVFYVISVLLASTTVMAQCTNGACGAANAIYKECKYSYTTLSGFRACLCTQKFLVNYDRCKGGWVCPWDGRPETLNNACIALYCPGEFDGGFDAKAFCSGYLPPTSVTTKRTTTTGTTKRTTTTATTKKTTTTGTTIRTTPTLTYGPIPIETGIA